jgi:hypothetical protein
MSSSINQHHVVSIYGKLRSSFPFLKIGVVLHFDKNWGCLPFCRKLRLSPIFPKIENLGHLTFTLTFKSPSIFLTLRFSSILTKKNVGRLPCLKKLGLFTIFQKIVVVFRFSIYTYKAAFCLSVWLYVCMY